MNADSRQDKKEEGRIKRFKLDCAKAQRRRGKTKTKN